MIGVVVTSVLIVTSVHSHVTDDLAASILAGTSVRPSIRSRFDAAGWTSMRADGRVASLRARLSGLVFPLTVDLGPRRVESVIVATTNPFWLPAAVAIRRPRARLVTLVYDVYPESLDVRLRIPRLLRSVVRRVTAFGMHRSAAVVPLGERTRDYLLTRYGLRCPTAVIPPGCAELPVVATPPASLTTLAARIDGRVVISYVGNMGSMHDATTLAEAVCRVLDADPGRCAVILSVRGDRAAQFVGPLADREEVTVLDQLEPDEWAWLNQRTDIALVSLAATAGLVSLPSKVFASLAGATAIFAVAPPKSDLADLITTLDVGLVTAPGDIDAAVDGMLQLIRDPDLRVKLSASALGASAAFTPSALGSRWQALLADIGGAG
jgi:glycosyltransferase involved in cell wall biosynthesis